MKKILSVLALVLMTSQSAFALLSPLYQSVIEIKSILQCEDLPRFLHQADSIVDIQKTDKGYVVVTQQVKMDVDVIYQQNQRPGPKEFDLHFNPPVPLNKADNQQPAESRQNFTQPQQQSLNR